MIATSLKNLDIQLTCLCLFQSDESFGYKFDTGYLARIRYRPSNYNGAYPRIDEFFTRDKSGIIQNVTLDNEFSVNYNDDLEITSVNHTLPSPHTETYTYDSYGRRLSKTVNGSTTNFHWEGDNLAMELDQDFNPIRRYTYGIGKDSVEGHIEFSEASANLFAHPYGWYSYIKDQVGTIYKIQSHQTQQTVTNRHYDTFGNLLSQSGPSKGNLGFQSKYFDQESGLNYFYHRYYNSQISRFTTEDPLGIFSDLNLYSFEKNNSIGFRDLYGLYIGQYPPPPPGYDPMTWTMGQWDNGKYVLTDPEGKRCTTHPEDRGHWRHWDIRDKNNNNKGSWPKKSKKHWEGQKKGLYSDQSECDPSGDAEPWSPSEYWTVKNYFSPSMIVFFPDLSFAEFEFSINFMLRVPFFRIPLFAW